jgi:hypothetical protein
MNLSSDVYLFNKCFLVSVKGSVALVDAPCLTNEVAGWNPSPGSGLKRTTLHL